MGEDRSGRSPHQQQHQLHAFGEGDYGDEPYHTSSFRSSGGRGGSNGPGALAATSAASVTGARKSIMWTLVAMSIIIVIASVGVLLLSSHGGTSEGIMAEYSTACISSRCVQLAGDVLANVAPDAEDACHSLFEYACGGYLERTAITDRSSTSAFYILATENRMLLKKKLDDLADATEGKLIKQLEKVEGPAAIPQVLDTSVKVPVDSDAGQEGELPDEEEGDDFDTRRRRRRGSSAAAAGGVTAATTAEAAAALRGAEVRGASTAAAKTAPTPAGGSAVSKAVAYYRLCNNRTDIESRGVAPLKAVISYLLGDFAYDSDEGDGNGGGRARDANTGADAAAMRAKALAGVLARHDKIGVGTFMGIGIEADGANSSMYIPWAYPTGLSLPAASYYKNMSADKHKEGTFGLLVRTMAAVLRRLEEDEGGDASQQRSRNAAAASVGGTTTGTDNASPRDRCALHRRPRRVVAAGGATVRSGGHATRRLTRSRLGDGVVAGASQAQWVKAACDGGEGVLCVEAGSHVGWLMDDTTGVSGGEYATDDAFVRAERAWVSECGYSGSVTSAEPFAVVADERGDGVDAVGGAPGAERMVTTVSSRSAADGTARTQSTASGRSSRGGVHTASPAELLSMVSRGVVGSRVAAAAAGGGGGSKDPHAAAADAAYRARAEAVGALERLLALIRRTPDEVAEPAQTYWVVDVARANDPVPYTATPTPLGGVASRGGEKEAAGESWVEARSAVGGDDVVARGVDWGTYFDLFVQNTSGVKVATVPAKYVDFDRGYMHTVSAILSQTHPQVIRDYISYHAAGAFFHSLPGDVQGLYGDLRERLTGVRAPPIKWYECTLGVDSAFPFVTGELFIRKYFPKSSKDAATAMVKEVKANFRDRMLRNPWMDDTTRSAALEKLDAMQFMIGYPDLIDTPGAVDDFYAAVSVVPTKGDAVDVGGWLGAQARLTAFHSAWWAAHLDREVDNTEWHMSAPTVNAYYSFTNVMVFPAGILRPPFYSADWPPAANLGGIGFVMGHEMTHGFDNSGVQYDAKGQLRAWRTEAATVGYNKRATCVEKQFDSYAITGPDGNPVHVKGKMTLGEDIADNGGGSISFDTAFGGVDGDEAEAAASARGVVIGLNYTAAQLYWLRFARSWCTVQTPAGALAQVSQDPHAPARWRVDGAAANHPGFTKAFSCKSEGGIVRRGDDQCVVW